MNKAIIESIEWHKDQLFKLLEDGDLYKLEGDIHSVQTDLNEIISIVKSEKKVWVKATATRKGHYRKVKGEKKEDVKEEDMAERWKKYGQRPEHEVKGFADEVSKDDIINFFGEIRRIKEIDVGGRMIMVSPYGGGIEKITFKEFNRGAKVASESDKSEYKGKEDQVRRMMGK